MSNALRFAVAISASLMFAAKSFTQEPPKPGPEHEKLKELVGTWDAEMEMNGVKSKAVAVYKSICGGLWLDSDFRGDFAGMKFQGHGLDGYDPQKKKYVSMWVDSFETAPMITEGDFDAKKNLFVMTGEFTMPDGKSQKLKTTSEFKDKDHFTYKMFMVQPDGGEQRVFTIEYTRRK
jgi:hypothetical protein